MPGEASVPERPPNSRVMGLQACMCDPNSRANAIALVAVNMASAITIVTVNKSLFSGLWRVDQRCIHTDVD